MGMSLRWLASLGWLLIVPMTWLTSRGNPAGDPQARDFLAMYFFIWLIAVWLGPKAEAGYQAETLRGSARLAAQPDLGDLLHRPKLIQQWGRLQPGAYVVGEWQKQLVVLTPKQTTEHVLLVGPSGTGKSSTQYMANAALATGSIVVADPKGELWRMTSGYHRSALRFAPAEPEASASCNWIPLCTEKRMADLLAEAVIQPGGGGGDRFFRQAAASVVSALFLYVATETQTPTPATAYNLLVGGGKALMDAFTASQQPSCRLVGNTYRDNDRTRDSVMAEVINKLGWLDDPAVARFTSASEQPPQFGRLLHEPMALYWVLHERDVDRLRPLTALFFTLLLDALTAPGVAPSAGAVPVTFLWDEFGSAGTIPGMATTIAVARGRGIGLVLGLQSLAQLEEHYGPAAAKTIRANGTTKLFLHGLEPEDAEYASRLCGDATIRHEAVSRSEQSWGSGGGRTSYSEQTIGRRLFTGDEVRRLGRDELLMVMGNRPPATLRKRVWNREPCPGQTRPLGPALAWVPPPPAPPRSARQP